MQTVKFGLVDGQKVTLDLPETLEEVLFRRQVSFEMEYEKARLFISDKVKTHTLAENRTQYLKYLCSAISEFFEIDLNTIFKIDIKNSLDIDGELEISILNKHIKDLAEGELDDMLDQIDGSLMNLYSYIVRLTNDYKPVTPRTNEDFIFNYKGEDFIIPHTIRNLYNGKKVLTPVSVQQAVETSQIRMYLNRQFDKKKDENKTADDHQQDANFRLTAALNEISLMALKRGEQLPLDDNELDNFIAERTEYFFDIDSKTTLDILFFSIFLWHN